MNYRIYVRTVDGVEYITRMDEKGKRALVHWFTSADSPVWGLFDRAGDITYIARAHIISLRIKEIPPEEGKAPWNR